MLLGAVFKATGNVSPVTVAAKGRWMFGAPTFFVGDQMFFGQDRLEFATHA